MGRMSFTQELKALAKTSEDMDAGGYERRAAERRERRKVPDWFSVQDLLPEPWEREARIPA